MTTVADNIATLNAYPLAQGAESDARLNVDKLRSLAPSAVIATARRIMPAITVGAPFMKRAGHPVILGPAIASS